MAATITVTDLTAGASSVVTVGVVGPQGPADVTSYKPPQRVVYTSMLDTTDDAVPGSNTGTDNTAVIQAELDGGDVHLIVDGQYLVDTLYVESNTTIEAIGYGFLFKKGQPNGGKPLLRNKNAVAGPTAPTDHDITIRNIYFDGNRRNYGSGNTGSNGALTAHRRYVNDLGYVTPTLGFYGVKRLTVENVRVYDSPAYGLHLANVQDFYVSNYSRWKQTGDVTYGDDIFHLNGHCHRGVMVGVFGECNDDGFAINANDGNDLVSPVITFEPGTVAAGPITGIGVRGIRFTSASGVCRFLTAEAASYIEDISVEDVVATVTGNTSVGAFHFDTFSVPGDGTYGYADNVTVRKVFVYGNSSPGVICLLNHKFGRLIFDDIKAEVGVGALLRIADPARGDRITLQNMTWVSSGATLPVTVTSTTGVNEINVDGFDCRPPNATPFAVELTGTVGRLKIHSGTFGINPITAGGGVAALVKLTAATVECVTVGGINQEADAPTIIADTASSLEKLLTYGVEAERIALVEPTTTELHDGSGWKTVYNYDLFAGSANSNLTAHTSDRGVTWPNDVTHQLGGNSLLLDGSGRVFLGGSGTSDTYKVFNTASQPATGNFTVEFDFLRKSALSAGVGQFIAVTINAVINLSNYLAFVIDAAATPKAGVASAGANPVFIQSSTTLPAVGTTWRVRLVVTSSGNDRTVKSYYSTNGGITWTSWFSDAAYTTASSPFVGIYGASALGSPWTSSTGYHIGNLVVRTS